MDPGFRRRHARIWRLSAPIILSGLSVPLLGAVDTGVVGRLSDPAYIGGVALGAMIFDFVFWGFGFLRLGTTGFAAQADGAGDTAERNAVLSRALLLALGLGVALLLLQAPIGWLAFSLLQGSDAVEAQAHIYYSIRIWSAPATLANYALLGWLLGRQRTGLVLAVELFLNLVNITLDLLFVLGLGWGVAGVAAASVAAEFAALGLALAIRYRLGHRVDWARERARILDRARLVGLMRVNFDILVRTLSLIAALALFTATGARMGDLPLAGNAILMNFFLLLSYGLDGFAHTAQILVGTAIGARDRAAYGRAVGDTTLWAASLAVVGAAAFALAGPSLVRLYSVNPEVQAAALAYLPWMAAMPVIAVWCFQFDGIYIGATRTAEMRNGMLLSLAADLVALWLFVPVWGNHGLWLSLAVFFAARGLTLGAWLPRIGRSIAALPG
jgi:MATE family, multidrug efflux pump